MSEYAKVFLIQVERMRKEKHEVWKCFFQDRTLIYARELIAGTY